VKGLKRNDNSSLQKESTNHFSNSHVDRLRGTLGGDEISVEPDHIELTEPWSHEQKLETKESNHPRPLETVLMPFIAELYTDVSHRLSTNLLDPWRPKNATSCPPSAPFIAELLSQADTSSVPDDAGDMDHPVPTGGAERTLLPFIAEMQMAESDGPLVYMSAEERKASWRAMQLALRDRLAARPDPVID
jgi:hypothetical protein